MAYVCDSLNEFGQGLNCIEHTELIVKFQMLPEISIAQGNAIGVAFLTVFAVVHIIKAACALIEAAFFMVSIRSGCISSESI
jgi:hypothetical protein